MSDIRFNQWLHQSGTGGVSQDHIGNIGIGTTNPSIVVSAANTAVLNVGVITANNLFVNNAFNGDITGNVTGNISGATGTFSGNVDIADKIIHTGDTDTAMRFPADNTFAVDTAGSERLRITSAGLVGIGTVSPSGPIHAHAASGTQRSYLEASASHSFLRLKSGSTSYNSGLEFFSGASNIANVTGLGAGGLLFEVNGSEKLRITSDGKVGIGTDMGGSPASNYGFGVYRASGTGYLYTETGGSSASAGLRAKAGTADFTIYTTEGTGQLAVYDNTNNVQRLKIDSSGKLKLGSNTLVTPSTDADNFVIDTGDVDSGISILSATTGRIYFGDAASNDQGSIRYVHTDNSMRFETNSGERLRINSVGNMGIGGAPLPTSTGYDGATLHLYQSAGTGGSSLRMTNGSIGHTTSDGFYMGYWDDGHLYFYNQEAGHIIVGTNSTERLRVSSDGKVHIGGKRHRNRST